MAASDTDNGIAPSGIDHLVYACPTLEQGMDEIEAKLGLRPAVGGHHPEYGTHNALLSLGPGVYLEIVARDPGLPLPKRGAWVDLAEGEESCLLTWVYRCADIEALKAVADKQGMGIGSVQSGRRSNPDGTEVCWTLTDPYAMPMNGAIPFLINWGETLHPSTQVPLAGQLEAIEVRHPEADRVRRHLALLGAETIAVRGGAGMGISATVSTARGPVTI